MVSKEALDVKSEFVEKKPPGTFDHLQSFKVGP